MAKNKKDGSPKKAAAKKKEAKKPASGKKIEKKIPSKREEKKKEVSKAAPKTTEQKKTTAKTEQAKSSPVQADAQKNTASSNMSTGTGKKRLMVSYEKLPAEVMEVIRTKYPYGYNHDLKEVKGIDNKKFFVLPIELPDVIYLVKVDLRKPIKITEAEEEEDMFTPEESFAGEEEGFPSEELEQIEGEGDDEGEESGGKKKKRKDDDDDDDI